MTRLTGRLKASSAIAALLALLAVFAAGDYSADAHPTVHPQKKLFSGRWYKPLADLDTSPPWFGVLVDGNGDGFADPEYLCDGGIDMPSCVAKWQGPAYASYADWNSQPSTARFNIQGYRNHNWDNNTYIVDTIQGAPPGLLGFAAFYNQSGQCAPDPYPGTIYCPVYWYSDAVIIDNTHTGAFGTDASKQATITHELGHVLSLRHESVNADESEHFPCGQDDTGLIPTSVMSYDCISPPGSPYFGSGIYTVQDWDTCGVNHAYPDPVYEWEECVCYPSSGGGPAPPPPSASYYHPVTPARILDTRFGPGPIGKLGHGCEMTLQVTGVGGVPSSGVTAVVINTTVTGATQASHLTIYPSGTSLPAASNLNFVAGQTVPNLVTLRVGTDGRVNIFNNSGQTHVIFDVVGWYGPASGDGFTPLSPARIMDTRIGLGWPGKLGHNGTATVDVTGVGAVPANGVTAVVLNTTVTEPTAPSHLTVYPSDASPPNASNLNFVAGQTVPNLVVVKVGAADGSVKVFNNSGQTHAIFDVVGWYGPGSGDLFTPLPPARIMDTRIGMGWPGKLGHNGTATVDVTGVGGVPANGVTAVIVNTTVTEPTAPSHLTVYPSNAPAPNASNLNFVPNQNVPNLVIVKVGNDGYVRVFNNSGQTHAIFDVAGYFAPPPP